MSEQPVTGLLLLASVLSEAPFVEGIDGGAIQRRLLKKVWRSKPDSFLVCNQLGSYVGYSDDRGDKDLDVRFCTAAVALRPNNALAHNRLGNALVTLYHAEPIFAGRARLTSDLDRDRHDEAIAELREAVRLRPDVSTFHGDLGCALLLVEEVREAVAEYREAMKLSGSRSSENLALYFFITGYPKMAVPEMREYIKFLEDPSSFAQGDFSEDKARLKMFEHMAELEDRLDSMSRGQDAPLNAKDKLYIAWMYRVRRNFTAAARFYRESFEIEPTLADDMASQHRLRAAIAAALAGAGPKSSDALRLLSDAERASWRAQALKWLRSERDAYANILEHGPARSYSLARKGLDLLAHHRDLSCVRDEDKLNELPEGERTSWRALWSEISRLLEASRSNR